MRHSLLLACLFLLSTLSFAQLVQHRAYGNMYPGDFIRTRSDGFVSAGYRKFIPNIHQTLHHFDANGQPIWHGEINANVSGNGPKRVTETTDGSFCFTTSAYATSTDMAVLKIDDNGGFEWARRGSYFTGVKALNDGGVIVYGQLQSFGGNWTPTVWKLDAQGRHVWAKGYGLVAYNAFLNDAIVGYDGIYLLGWASTNSSSTPPTLGFVIKTDFLGNVQSSYGYDSGSSNEVFTRGFQLPDSTLMLALRYDEFNSNFDNVGFAKLGKALDAQGCSRYYNTNILYEAEMLTPTRFALSTSDSVLPFKKYVIEENAQANLLATWEIAHEHTFLWTPFQQGTLGAIGGHAPIPGWVHSLSITDHPARHACDTFVAASLPRQSISLNRSILNFVALNADTLGWDTLPWVNFSYPDTLICEDCRVTADFSQSMNGNQIQFTNLSTGGITSVLWDFGDGTTDTSWSPLHSYAQPGQYQVCLTVQSQGCSNFTCQTVNIPVGLEAGLGAALHLYPQPAGDLLQVQLPSAVGEWTLRLIGPQGRYVEGISARGSGTVQLDLDVLASGVYFLEAVGDGNRIYRKFLHFNR